MNINIVELNKEIARCEQVQNWTNGTTKGGVTNII